MFVTAFLAQKGGVGKSTTTREAAAMLAKWGFRVAVGDGNDQGTTTEALLQSVPAEGMAELLGYRSMSEGKKKIQDVMVPSEAFGVQVVGAHFIRMNEQENALRSDTIEGNLQLLEGLSRSDGAALDFFLIDGPPNFGPFMINAAIAADGVIVPFESAQESNHALGLLMATFSKYERLRGSRVPVLAAVITRYEGGANVDQRLLEDIRSAKAPGVEETFFPRVLTVRKTTGFKRAFEERKPLYKIARSETERAAVNEIAAIAALIALNAGMTLPPEALKISNVKELVENWPKAEAVA